jgi:hypothetical protein
LAAGWNLAAQVKTSIDKPGVRPVFPPFLCMARAV